jgi:hypothetical protein
MSDVTRKFSLAQLKEWGLPYDSLTEVDTFTELGGGRWNDCRTTVFEAPDDGQTYALEYEVGKTEYQDYDWYEFLDDPTELSQVEQQERVIVEWKPVQSG